MYLFIFFISLLLFIVTCYGENLAAENLETEKNATDYLKKYGYIDQFSSGGPAELKASIERFQYFANLNRSGKLDAPTLHQMTIPRCGLQDPKITFTTRRRRYVHQGTKWIDKNLLTWRLENRGRTLDRDTIRGVMKKAIELWSREIKIDFNETSADNPDIWVKFVTRYHDDPYSFDGVGGTLAHAYYPHNNELGLNGDVHFDDDENYTHESELGRNLLWVATHELGHSLGMEHSNVRDAVMYPWYTAYKPGFKLNKDDIDGIQALYESRVSIPDPITTTAALMTTAATATTTTTTTKAPRPIPRSKECPTSSINSIYYNSYARLQVIVTQTEKLYFVNSDGIRYGPVTLRNYLPWINGEIDASLMTKKLNNRDNTLFFVGSNYYVYQHFRHVSGPHSIHGDISGDANPLNLTFPLMVEKIDAVMTWHRNQRTYFFAGPYYWRYDMDLKQFDVGYPRLTSSAWQGIPDKIDSAFCSETEKKTYFISGNQFYMFDDYYVRMKLGYPEHIGREWLNCGGINSMAGSSLTVGGANANEIRGRDV